MVNQLEDLCEERGIKVEFITSKFIDDNNDKRYNKPVIKVHKVFKECPMRVATAVVEIFTGEGYVPDCIEIIERYLTERFGPVGIRIQPPKVIKIGPVKNTANNIYEVREDSLFNNKEKYLEADISNEEQYIMADTAKEEQYIEADISYIDAVNLKGMQKNLINNEIIMENDQDVLELDIVVMPPIT